MQLSCKVFLKYFWKICNFFWYSTMAQKKISIPFFLSKSKVQKSKNVNINYFYRNKKLHKKGIILHQAPQITLFLLTLYVGRLQRHLFYQHFIKIWIVGRRLSNSRYDYTGWITIDETVKTSWNSYYFSLFICIGKERNQLTVGENHKHKETDSINYEQSSLKSHKIVQWTSNTAIVDTSR